MVSNNFQFHGDKILRRSALMIISSSESMVFPEVELLPEVALLPELVLLPEVVPADVPKVVELSYLAPRMMLVDYLTNNHYIFVINE